MPHDKELEIRVQFLEEATEYLNTIESGMLGLATARFDKQMDAVLRAAHSIKGGAAMMGFQTLSHLAHRLEDFFRVLKTQKPSVDAELESLLLAGVDCLRQVVDINRQGTVVDEQWLDTNVNPVFEQLHQRLGEPQVEDIMPEDGQDMVGLIFETEVEECLQRLESLLAEPNKPSLLEELSIMAQDLGGLGEMLELNAFRNLCESITQHLEATPEQVEEIARLALHSLRRSQAAVLVGQVDTLPTQIELGKGGDLLTNPIVHQIDSKIVPSVLSEFKSEAPLTDIKEHQENTVRVPVKLLDQINDLFGELTIARNGINLYLQRLRNLVRNLSHRVRTLQRMIPRTQNAYDKIAIPATEQLKPNERTPNQETNKNNFDEKQIAADSDRQLLPLQVTENIVRIQEVTDDIDLSLEDTDQTVNDLNRTAKHLQTSLTQVRMRPLSDLLVRFPRFVRDLCLEYGKNVELKIHGGETLIDRTILEALNDPLMHLLRNAFDHGIEDPETRFARGKLEQGVIEIKAVTRGNQTLIAVSDDGSGIDLDAIRRQAEHLDLDASELAFAVGSAVASDEKLLSFIFEPGFSTAGQVTALSGRGVGLDVVRTNLREIRGDIKVNTQLGVGTTFTLSVPLTLSVARVLLVESNEMLLAFPSDVIEEMLLLNQEQILTISGNEVFSWEEYMAPLIRLSHWLEFRCPRKTPDFSAIPIMNAPTVLILAVGNERVAIQVDRCWGEQEVAIRQVEGTMSQEDYKGAPAMPPGFNGCTILGDGQVVPLVDAPELLQWIASCKLSYDSQPENKSPTTRTKSHKHTILVVDDSINVRRFLSLTLERAGYRVELANDGQDALEKLLTGLHIQAVISDIDMPRLDGYGLLARVKSNPAFKQLPIAMLSSRSGHKDRQLAMNLGATAYFSKPYNEQELLQTLKQLIQD